MRSTRENFTMDASVQRIIEYIDQYLTRANLPCITPPDANKMLDKAGLLKDRPERSGLPLRNLLRAGLLPHAFQEPPAKNGKWFIPRSK